ncbi:MAG: DUF547 domain-containing protein [Ferruginibacter sp.]
MKVILNIVFALAFPLLLAAQKAPSHDQWTKVLGKYVNEAGLVNYKGLLKDKASLDAYLKTLSDNPPKDSWSKEEQMAFWINAYNAFTIDLILQHYPVKSIKDIGASIKIPFVSTGWDIKFINIGGKKYDLNNIEHGILRKKFDDPRIHFALVCASMSCPKLRNEAYTAAKINQQLEAAGKDFLNDKSKNDITSSRARISNYFSWYKRDFTDKSSLPDFINKYSNTKMNGNTKISYLDYNWSLNEQK